MQPGNFSSVVHMAMAQMKRSDTVGLRVVVMVGGRVFCPPVTSYMPCPLLVCHRRLTLQGRTGQPGTALLQQIHSHEICKNDRAPRHPVRPPSDYLILQIYSDYHERKSEFIVKNKNS